MNTQHSSGGTQHFDDWPPIRLDDLLTQQQLVDRFPHVVTKTAISFLMRERDRLGVGPAFVKSGKRFLISQARFEYWLANRRTGAQ